MRTLRCFYSPNGAEDQGGGDRLDPKRDKKPTTDIVSDEAPHGVLGDDDPTDDNLTETILPDEPPVTKQSAA